MKKNIFAMIAIAIIFGGAGFFGGMKYQQSRRLANFQGMAGNNQRFRIENGNRQFFRPINGEITSVDEKSITVKLPDGSSKIVIISQNTKINKIDQTTKDELKTGIPVTVIGQENSDGSVTAQSIQLNSLTRSFQNETR